MPQLDVSAAVGYAWKKFTEHVVPFVLLMLVVFVVMVVGVAIYILAIPSGSGFGALLVTLFVSFLFAVLAFMVQAGVWRAALGVTRGQTPEIEQLFETTNLVPYALTVLIVGVVPNLVIDLIGFYVPILEILLRLVLIAWFVFTAFAALLALDRGMEPIQAITTSIKMVTDNLGEVILILIVAGAIYVVGFCLLGVGLLVSAPVALVTIVYAYRALNQQTVVA